MLNNQMTKKRMVKTVQHKLGTLSYWRKREPTIKWKKNQAITRKSFLRWKLEV